MNFKKIQNIFCIDKIYVFGCLVVLLMILKQNNTDGTQVKNAVKTDRKNKDKVNLTKFHFFIQSFDISKIANHY